jgi:hypothetical protein
MSLVIIVGGFSLIVSMDSLRSHSFQDERDLIVNALQKARSQSINNMCFGAGCTDGKPHGVHIMAGQYVLFQGSSYHDTVQDAALDEVFKSVYAAATVTGFTDVVFSPLSGNASTSPTGVMTLTVSESPGINTSVITVGGEGQILWTH